MKRFLAQFISMLVVGVVTAVAAPSVGLSANQDATDSAGVGSPDLNTIYKFSAGDKVKFTFYSRDDLSGVYKVRLDGKVSLPFIGSFSVSGKSAQQLESEVSAALTQLTKRPSFLTVEAVEWQPIYVVGSVTAAGSYPFVTNMTVLHALAVAGGGSRLDAAGGDYVNIMREASQRNIVADNLHRALTKLSRLESERNNFTKLTPTGQLLGMVGRSEANRLLSYEQPLFELRRDSFRRRENELTRSEVLVGNEMAALESQHRYIQEEITQRTVELGELQKLANRNLISRARLYPMKYQISNLRSDASEVKASIARVSRKLAQVQNDLGLLRLNSQGAIEAEIQTTNKEIFAQAEGLRWSKFLTGTQGATLVQTGFGTTAAPLKFQIVRLDSNVFRTFDAKEQTRLMPGDVLRVSRVTAAGFFGRDGTLTQEANYRVNPTRSPASAADAHNIQNRIDVSAEAPGQSTARTDQVGRDTDGNVELKEEIARLRRQLKAQEMKYADLQKQLRATETAAAEKTTLKSVKRDARALLKPGLGKNQKLPPKQVAAVKAAEPAGKLSPTEPVRSLAWKLQSQLMGVGCSPRMIDGIWGRRSRAALNAFRKATSEKMQTYVPTSTALRLVERYAGKQVCVSRIAALRR